MTVVKRLLIGLMLGLAVSGCAFLGPGSARTNVVYEAKAAKSAAAANSGVQTAILTIEALAEKRITQNYASQTVEDAAATVTDARASFATVQSPSEVSDELGGLVSETLTQADETMQDVVTNVRRGTFDQLDFDAQQLNRLSSQLRQINEDNS